MGLQNNLISEGRMIRGKLAAYGYKNGRVPMNYTSDLAGINMTLNGVPENSNVVGFKCATSDIARKSKEVLESYFNLHDVPYLSFQQFAAIFNRMFPERRVAMNSIDKIYEFYDAIKNNCETISPFDLPINLVDGHSMVGDIQKNILFLPDTSVMEKTPIVFSGVNLGENVTLLSAATFGHEVIHSQLESVKGSCLEYYNKEVVPIFVEKLMAKDLDPSGRLLKKSEELRADWLRSSINIVREGERFHTKEELLEATVYIHSTIKAERLFDMYINGDIDTQIRILNDIQKVFDSSSTVDDVLERNNITYSNSVNWQMTKKRKY